MSTKRKIRQRRISCRCWRRRRKKMRRGEGSTGSQVSRCSRKTEDILLFSYLFLLCIDLLYRVKSYFFFGAEKQWAGFAPFFFFFLFFFSNGHPPQLESHAGSGILACMERRKNEKLIIPVWETACRAKLLLRPWTSKSELSGSAATSSQPLLRSSFLASSETRRPFALNS